MWATLPQLKSQPALEFVPDQPERVQLPQSHYVLNNSGIDGNPTCFINPALTDGSPITLESLVQNIHAVHVVLGMQDEPDFSFCLGDRYRLTISTFSNSDPLHPFMGVGQAAVRTRIQDNGADVASANLPFIPATPTWRSPHFTSGLCVCFGYARNDAGQLKAYANVSYFGARADCGSKTVNLIADVDEQDALPGKMKIVVRHGVVGFNVMACRIGPFEKTEHHVLETTYSKKTRDGDRVASLRSKASNFSSPAHFLATTAQVDCGGHSEFLTVRASPPTADDSVCLFAPSLAGQPDADTAYVACSDSWRSNCGFSLAHARKTSAIRVQAERWNVLPDFFVVRIATFDISMESDSYGNNEYAGEIGNVPRDGLEVRDWWDTLHVAARITGFEDVEDPFDSPLSAVRPRTQFTVTVTVFASKEGERASVDGVVVGASATKTLTEEEAVAFFEGSPIALADGTVSITAVGG
jgi:hypothetical protein